MRRAAAPARRAAAAVEDRQLDTPAGRDARQLLLRAVDLPLRGEIAAVLAGVRVAHHHLEAPARAAVEDLLDERARSAQVGDRLEQRHALRARRRPRARAPRRRARRRPCGSWRRSGGRRRRAPCRACAAAAAASVARIRSSGAWIAEAWTRTSSFARWRPNVRARARRSARRAVGDPLAAVGAEQRVERVEIGDELAAVRVPVGAEPLPDLDEDGAERLVGVADARARAPITVVDIPHAAPSSRSSARYSSRASWRARSSASSTVSGPTFGLPSRSPPIQVPNRSASPAPGEPLRRARARARGSRSRSSARRTRGPAGSRRRPAAAWSGSRPSARAA